MIRHHLKTVPSTTTRNRGFTLVEMLIAVALVLVVMLLFTQIFQIATESLSKQRGLAENDQRARMLTTTLRSDLAKRTFRDVTPFQHNEDTSNPAAHLNRRSGYFYYAENDPTDDTDDILAFTTRSTIDPQNLNTLPYTGKATLFNSSTTTPAVVSESPSTNQFTVQGDVTTVLAATTHIWIEGSSDPTNGSNDGRYTIGVPAPFLSGSDTVVTVTESVFAMTQHGNLVVTEFQPDIDDGSAGNSLGQSVAAEISYFLRGSILYRRVLLIRDSDSENAQPRLTDGTRLITSTYPITTPGNTFWNDFDYAAYFYRGCFSSGPPATRQLQGVRFISASESLSNDANSPRAQLFDTAPTSPFYSRDQFKVLSFGVPQMRFGHDPWTGIPREFVDLGDGTSDITGYIGRFTLAECSFPGKTTTPVKPAFDYPGAMAITANSDPSQDSSPVSMVMPLTLNAKKVVDNFSDSTVTTLRRGEDILLSNVLTFDVKIFDSTLTAPRFVDLGDPNISGGSFSTAQNPIYCPGTSRFRYDTWHPQAEIISPTNVATRNSTPPFSATATAIQVTVNYRDRSTGTVRQLTIEHSLTDRWR